MFLERIRTSIGEALGEQLHPLLPPIERRISDDACFAVAVKLMYPIVEPFVHSLCPICPLASKLWRLPCMFRGTVVDIDSWRSYSLVVIVSDDGANCRRSIQWCQNFLDTWHRLQYWSLSTTVCDFSSMSFYEELTVKKIHTNLRHDNHEHERKWSWFCWNWNKKDTRH